MSYFVFNKVICSNDFVNQYFIDPTPFGDAHPVKEEYITFNRICGAFDLGEYREHFGEHIYYGFGHSIKVQDKEKSEVKFATSHYFPIAAIVRAIELDHSVIWYAVGEELTYVAKFLWSDGNIVEMTSNLETQAYYDWDEDPDNTLWETIDDCDCEVWYYIENHDIKWDEWPADDLIRRYKKDLPISQYFVYDNNTP